MNDFPEGQESTTDGKSCSDCLVTTPEEKCAFAALAQVLKTDEVGHEPVSIPRPKVFERVFQNRGKSSKKISPEVQISLDPPPGDFLTMVASDPDLLSKADDLVRERYHWRGYESSDDLDRSSGTRKVLVALQNDQVVGTVTLGFDGPQGLSIDRTYPETASAARKLGRSLVELTRLATSPRVNGRRVLAALFSLAYKIGRIDQKVTDLMIEVNPRHVPVYQKLFGFTAVSEVRFCDRVEAPAVLLWLDLDNLDRQIIAPPKDA